MIMDMYIDEYIGCLSYLKTQEEWIKCVAEMLADAGFSKQIFICGNGGSAAIASHMVNDLQKMCWLRAISLTDNVPLITTWANDTHYSKIFTHQLKRLAKPGDILIVFSGSGKSENIIDAIKYGLENGLNVIALVGTNGGDVAKMDGIKFLHVGAGMQQSEDAFSFISHLISLQVKDILDER